MSRTARIDFHFGGPQTLAALLPAFEATGASPTRRGVVFYHSDDMYDWTESPVDELESVLTLLANQLLVGQPVSIEVNWPDMVGGNLCLLPGRLEVGFVLSADCLKASEGLPFADMGWYLRTLIPVLAPLGLCGVVSRDGYLNR